MLCLELFKGTGSIGKSFEKLGWAVISLDRDQRFRPTICVDILEWDYSVFPRNHFDFVWASPVCTENSKAKTVGTRDLEGADKLVKRTLEIMKYFGSAHYCFENPESGKTCEIVKGVAVFRYVVLQVRL